VEAKPFKEKREESREEEGRKVWNQRLKKKRAEPGRLKESKAPYGGRKKQRQVLADQRKKKQTRVKERRMAKNGWAPRSRKVTKTYTWDRKREVGFFSGGRRLGKEAVKISRGKKEEETKIKERGSSPERIQTGRKLGGLMLTKREEKRI